MRRLAAGLLCGLLLGMLAAVARPDPRPRHHAACTLADAARTVAARGLAFIGPPWLAEYLLVSRKPGSVVEISAPVRIGLRSSLASRLYPDVAHVPDATFGGAYLVNVEDLLRRRPAVALQAGFADRLLALGLCAVPLGAKYGTDAGIAEHTQTYAALAGTPEHGSRLFERFQAAMDALARDLAASGDGRRAPRVLVMGMSPHGAIFAQGGRHPATAFIARAGGVNALLDVRSLGVRLDTERLFALDPDAVFLVQALAGDTPSPEALRSSRLGRLRAVAAGRVFALPTEWTMMDSVVATPSYERWMAERLHPDLPGSARESLRRAYADEVGVVLPEPWLDDALSEARR